MASQVSSGLASSLKKKTQLKIILLEDFFPTLPLCGEAGDGPHLDLHPRVELLPPHIPHAVTGRCHSAVLKRHDSVTAAHHSNAVESARSHSHGSHNSCVRTGSNIGGKPQARTHAEQTEGIETCNSGSVSVKQQTDMC